MAVYPLLEESKTDCAKGPRKVSVTDPPAIVTGSGDVVAEMN